jgi:hypothetical protein
MKMTNFKSLQNVFGVFLGLILVFLLSLTSEVKAQGPAYGLPILKTRDQIAQITGEQLLALQNERKQSCQSQDPTEPCAKRLLALMEAYMHIQNYIIDQPNMSEYDIIRAIYPITNMHNLTVVPEAVNMTGFANKQYNVYFIEILDRIKV